MTELTHHNRQQWLRKPSLRAVYEDLYCRIGKSLKPGLTLEIGGGSGNLKALRREVISSDIARYPWLDLVADAQRLPIAANSIANIVLFDVLHHLEFPMLFFREAERVLQPRGRIVMVEPAITLASGFVYRHFHREPVIMDADPFVEGVPDAQRDPFSSNQAIPTLIFVHAPDRLRQFVPYLAITSIDMVSLFAYPLTGGFNPWSLIPAALVRPIVAFENRLPRSLRRALAFRIMVCLEKTAPRANEVVVP
jgi:SAM-dependent methyltransferase